jgi:integrase/recombinase XerD
VRNLYFIRPTTIDRIRASWIGEAIEGYVVWLTEQKYAARNVAFRVPVLVRFGEFARRSGVNDLDELPAHIEPFIEDWLNSRKQGYSESQRSVAARELRNPIRQLLHLILPHYGSAPAGAPDPFVDAAPGSEVLPSSLLWSRHRMLAVNFLMEVSTGGVPKKPP